MLIKILIYYIFGYLNITVEGFFTERFINTCLSKGIMLWNIKREKSSFIHANVSITDYKKLKSISKKTGCKYIIKAKKGLPFILNKYKKRKIFAFSLMLIMFILMITSNFIWNIEVVGNDRVEANDIIKHLEESGIKIGKYKRGLDTKKAINDIRLKRSDIAWIGINVAGTNVIVEVVETHEKPEIINKEEYCDIVSDKEGVITKITPQNGTAVVNVGDVVRKGSILIGGYIEGKFTGTRYLHAEGEISARVWHRKTSQMTYTTDVEESTGKKENKYAININNFQINFYKKLSNFEKYDTMIENKKIKLFSNFYLPISLIKTTNEEKTTKSVTYTKEEAQNVLVEKLEKELMPEVEGKNIVNRQVNVVEGDTSIEVELIYETLENIGTKEKIVF